ncbi:MAG TPA: FtsX-like permease family protein [Steroidobacteraceae bacterium]|nr:FtsX-like permease family protein [Steroidobacteraceae bacterium]
MRLLAQTLLATRVSLLTLPQRTGSSLVIIVCMACVVGVLLSMLSVTVGLLHAYQIAGSPQRALVLSRDALAFGGRMEETSVIPSEAIGTLAGAPGIALDADGKLMMDAEVLAALPPTEGFADGSLFVRGVGAKGLALRPEFKLVSGRLFRPGLHEMIVGTGAARGFGLRVGDRIVMPDGAWSIVGEFSTGGGINESELMGDVVTVMSIRRTTNASSVLVGLDSAAAFDAFERWLTRNPALQLTAERQSDYYRRVAWSTSAFFTAVAYLSGVVMALGALFGAVKILHAAVDVRTREIATLSAIGYDALPMALSVVLEGMTLTLVGALIGASLARILVDGRTEIIWNAVFTLSVPPGLIALGVAWALVLAVLSGISPAVRSARLSVAEALRQA